MDQRERMDNFEEGWRAAFLGMQANLWTALPGIVQSYDDMAMTVEVQPAIQARVRSADGTFSWVSLSPCADVPVLFPTGGGFTLTFPISAGDECLLVFSSRCIDNWWQNGGPNNTQAEIRLHDPSDAFAVFGPRSQPRVLGALSTTTAQLRSDDGELYLELAEGHVVNIVAPGGVNIMGPVVITGNLHVTGTTIGTEEGTFNSIPVSSHIHGEVMSGPDETGAPIA